MITVYCIPGMGVNERLFKNLQLENCTIKHVKWVKPLKNETLKAYALRLAEQIDTSSPYALLGVSFGGMCATEIAKELNPVKTFVISSCKLSSEIPFKIKLWRNFPLYKTLPDKIYIQSALLLKKQFGITNKEQQERFLQMLKTAPKEYFKGAVHCIISWKNTAYPTNVVHIHGSKDDILPIQKINAHYTIEGGSHFMIINKANEINTIINNELRNYI